MAEPIIVLSMEADLARAVWHAISTTITLMDEVGEIPKNAPLYGQRDRLVSVARRLDHEIRHVGGPEAR